MVNFEANNDHYSTVSLLGQCWDGLAIVHLAKHIPSDKMVALKRFYMDKVKEESNLVEVRTAR